MSSANNANALLAATRLWHHVDAKGLILGRLASKIAITLQGKHKPTYFPATDSGDYVVVTNCRYLQVTGRKLTQKLYHSDSGYPGGKRTIVLKNMLEQDPCEVLKRAVWGMLPRNKSRLLRMERLKMFPNAGHSFAQQIYKQYMPKFEGDTSIVSVPGNIYTEGKTAFITGASRGIGKAIALRLASEGANVAVVAKTVTPHPKLPGTIYSAAKEIEEAGGKALPIACDIRFEEQIVAALQQTFEHFGSIDIVVNNASAINLSSSEELSMKAFDLMNQINLRGTFAVSKHAIPYLKKSKNPHILMLSPPISLEARWFSHHTAYTMAKYGMSMCVLGMAQEFASAGIAVNALWPKTVIATAALNAISPAAEQLAQQGRKAEIVADAAAVILSKPSREFSGNFCIDQQVLEQEGVRDFSAYSVAGIAQEKLLTDLFVDSGAIGESKL